MVNTKLARLATLVLLLGIIAIGYGGLCGKKDKDSSIVTDSSAASTTLKGTVFQQTSDNNILPSGDAIVTVSWTETTIGGVIGKSVARSESAKAKSDGTYEISIPKNTPVTVTITSPDTTTSTENIVAGDDAPKNSAILKGRGKKIGLIKKSQETVLNTFDDTSMPRCQITVPANAVSADVDNVYLTATHQGENLPALPNGYIFLAGADFNASTPVIFNPGKEATPYITLPLHFKAEELVASVNIRLMELVNGAWIITNTGGRGKVYITGEWANCIGPDIAMPAKLKGIRPWCWVLIQTATASASGTVRDAAGNPVAGAFIFGGGSRTHSRPDGTYTLRNIAVIRTNALVALNAVANGYNLANKFVSFSPGEAKPNINFILEEVTVAQTGEIYGKVTNAADASAISGAMVTLQTPPAIRGLRYDNKGTETDLTDDTFYVIPPSGVVISSYKWMLILPNNSVFTSTTEAGASVVLQQLAREAINGGVSLTTGAYKVALEVTYSGGKKSVVAGGFLFKISTALSLYLADVKLPLSLQDHLVLKSVTDSQGNYRFVSLPVDETFSIWAKADGFTTADQVSIAALTAGQRKQQDFALTAASTDTTAPSAPTNVTATAQTTLTGGLSIFLTWSASTDNIGIDHYRVYRDGVEIGRTTLTSYFDNAITATTTYQYQVSAFDKANLSTMSDSISITTPGVTVDNTLPETPTNLSAIAINPYQINLRWQDNATNEDGFIIERSTDGTNFSYLLPPGMAIILVNPPPPHTPANITAYSDTIALSPTTTYYYRVYARSATDYVSGYSDVISATTPAAADVTAPTAPANITATAVSSGQISLAWSASTDAVGVVGYKVYRNNAYVASTPFASYSDSGLLASTTYSYAVSAFDAAGNTSAQSASASATTRPFVDTQAPTAPTGLTASIITDTWVTVTWNPATDNIGVAGYNVYRNDVLCSTLSAITFYTDVGLTPSTPYTYTASAFDASGNTSYLSSVLAVTTLADSVAPVAPTGLSATAVSSAQIDLTWNSSTDNIGVVSYKVYRNGILSSTFSAGGGSASGMTSLISYSDTGLAGSTTYSYTVAAYDAAGNTSAQSASVQATTPAAVDTQAPTIPTGLTTTSSLTSYTYISLTWSPSTDNVAVTGYKVYRDNMYVGSTSGTIWNTIGLPMNTNYSFAVAAYDAAGNISAQSIAVTGTTLADTTAPAVPAGLTGTAVSSTQINLSWDVVTDNIGVAGYKVYRNSTLITSLLATGYSDVGLTAGTQYAYTVAAYDGAGNTSAQCSAVNITTQPAGNALVAHWKFDETSGTTAGDSSGNGNNGTVYGATWSGGALSFDGVDDYVVVPDSATLDITNEITIEAWITAPWDGGTQTIVRKDWSYSLWKQGTSILSHLAIGGQYKLLVGTGVAPALATKWVYVTYTYDGTTAKIYVDGALVASTSITGSIDKTNSNLLIGATLPTMEKFKGKMDDVKIYNYARSVAEIQAAYEAKAKIVFTGSYNTPGQAFAVYVSGSYAYVADEYSGLKIINISNPAVPALAGSCDTAGAAVGIYVSGSYAYVADYSSGLQIINISNPAAPTLVGSYDTPTFVYDVYVSGSYAYIADGYSGIKIINISNPATPILAGSYDTPNESRGVYVSGNYAYIADGLSGLQIVNISNPAAPALVGSYDTPDFAVSVYVSGSYAYVADESSGLQVINISNPAAPTLVGSYNTPFYAWGVYVLGGYAYVADRESGLQIISIFNPAAPTLAGSYDTPGYAFELYVLGGYVYIADGYSGLQIIQVK